MTQHIERQIEITDKRGCLAYINTTIYPHTIVATSDGEHITKRQMEKALKHEFPRHTFFSNSFGGDYIRCDAYRWTGDGV